jgi:hypothetical protein
VHLVSKVKVGEEDSIGEAPVGPVGAEDEPKVADHGSGVELASAFPSDRYDVDRPGWAVMTEGVPTVVAADQFRYKYRCSHCGHEWSEVHEKVAEGRAKGYTGD